MNIADTQIPERERKKEILPLACNALHHIADDTSQSMSILHIKSAMLVTVYALCIWSVSLSEALSVELRTYNEVGRLEDGSGVHTVIHTVDILMSSELVNFIGHSSRFNQQFHLDIWRGTVGVSNLSHPSPTLPTLVINHPGPQYYRFSRSDVMTIHQFDTSLGRLESQQNDLLGLLTAKKPTLAGRVSVSC